MQEGGPSVAVLSSTFCYCKYVIFFCHCFSYLALFWPLGEAVLRECGLSLVTLFRVLFRFRISFKEASFSAEICLETDRLVQNLGSIQMSIIHGNKAETQSN